MNLLSSEDLQSPRRLTALLGSILLLLALWSWLEYRGACARCSSHASMVRQIEQMHSDAQRIATLRSAPRVATERERPNDELLSQVRTALAEAQLSEDHWLGNDPSPSVRVPNSPYKRLATRLTFEDISLHQLVQFTYALVTEDSSLSVTRLLITAPRDGPDDRWNVELTVSYLIYSPYRRQPVIG